jgi:thiamine kinase-like enzyme
MEYIIVQAGGLGSRMLELTRNKPKALIPFNNKPLIFHLFSLYPDSTFIVVGDYKFDILEKYLKVFAQVKFILVNSTGHKGTISGIKEAVTHIPDGCPFLILWSDLILSKENILPPSSTNIIGLSDGYECRWSYENGNFFEKKSLNGVAGYFYFLSKNELIDIPYEGEFVRWLSTKRIIFQTLSLTKSFELGTFDKWLELNSSITRPFNRITFDNEKVIKESVNEDGEKLINLEKNWYKFCLKNNFKSTPLIYSFNPFIMNRIVGKNVYEFNNLSINEKKVLILKIVNLLKSFHNISSINSNYKSFFDTYINKTFNRINKVKPLIPFASLPYIMINNRLCSNIFFKKDELIKLVSSYFPISYTPIHGDPTFSNILVKNNNEIILIDPRGYFGSIDVYGDANYDWAKLYYSLKGNYDNFNKGKFKLKVNDSSVEYYIENSSWEVIDEYFISLINDQVNKKQLLLYMSLIWFGLTTYSWHDYDSILASFYTGSYYLQEALSYERK